MSIVEYAEVARAESPHGEVVLRRRDGGGQEGLELRVNGVLVMETSETSTEEALARSALAQVVRPARVLVGGLGLGFTACQVLADLRVERLVVAEIEDVLVGWFRDGTVPGGVDLLDEPRLEVAVGDLRDVVASTPPGSLDLVLLDVDNGPDHLVLEANARLYRRPFLAAVRAALADGGAVVVWSSTRCEALTSLLEEVFEDAWVQEYPVSLQGKQESYWLHGARQDRATLPRARKDDEDG